ncbi:ABC transporter ATP-binding protein/permease [Allokutzneria sp. A3M-2-11 16]|uniref:ABC transporter ATP-binding protein n=1 Tax=Allokutzneria sp. A3M-2-11 16 TaxID=2962043 RepID=UPI0020B712D6|nr:ABC transporter ATP-binding protein [Allokutzneria sp. A3M-2-11 16]MCP3803392.1 ABC transporter ATP-binding protein/permease [Allokutzneria sp. A3M-2-11 16]
MPIAWTLLRPVVVEHRRVLVAVVAWSGLAALPVLLSGRLVALALDRGFLAGRGDLGLLALGCYGIALVVAAFGTRRAVRSMGGFTEAVRDHLVRSVVRGELHAAVNGKEPPAPGVAARIVNQVEAARQITANLVMSVTSAALMVVAAVVGLCAMAPAVIVGLAPLVVVCSFVLAALSRTWRRRYEAALTREEDLAADVGEVLEGLRDVAACAATNRALADLDRRARAHTTASVAVADLGGIRIGVIGLAARAPLVLLLALAPSLLAGGALSTGELVGAVVYLASGLEPAWRAVAEMLGNQGVELTTLLARLARASRTTEGVDHDGMPARPGDLVLRDATFRYGPHSEPVLDNANLVIRQGERVAVIGASGIGKSTLATVLSGLETPENGTVELGGVALASLRTTSLRSSIALVPQESYVFAGTFRENLTYLAPTADDAALEHTVAEVGLAELLHRHGGYDALVRPHELSLGERQLLVIARVHLSPAAVVVLDEATCHLDPVAEERAERALHRRGGTLVVVAHRISSALRAPRVLVLDRDGLVSGSHDRLARCSPTYAHLVGHWMSTSDASRIYERSTGRSRT